MTEIGILFQWLSLNLNTGNLWAIFNAFIMTLISILACLIRWKKVIELLKPSWTLFFSSSKNFLRINFCSIKRATNFWSPRSIKTLKELHLRKSSLTYYQRNMIKSILKSWKKECKRTKKKRINQLNKRKRSSYLLLPLN